MPPQPIPPSVRPEPDNRILRQQAAQLIEAVLDERMEARLAILRWPEQGLLPDPSLEIAYQALWHFEADETQQQSELFYLDAQLELLRQIAWFLKDGRDLPAHFLQGYSPAHQPRYFYDVSPVTESMTLLRRLCRRSVNIWRQALQLNPLLNKKFTA